MAMTLRELHNCLAIMRSIDAHELPESWRTSTKIEFVRDPYGQFLRMDNERQQAVWNIIERRANASPLP